MAARNSFEYNLLSLDRDVAERIAAASPVFAAGTIPAGVYERQDYDVIVLQTGNIMVTNANIPEDVMYNLTKSIFENLDVLYAAHPATRGLKLEVAVKEVIPFHPGAKRYYVEQGVMSE